MTLYHGHTMSQAKQPHHSAPLTELTKSIFLKRSYINDYYLLIKFCIYDDIMMQYFIFSHPIYLFLTHFFLYFALIACGCCYKIFLKLFLTQKFRKQLEQIMFVIVSPLPNLTEKKHGLLSVSGHSSLLGCYGGPDPTQSRP